MTHTIILTIALCASACAARSKYDTLPAQTRTDVLAHYARGESFDKLASEFHLGSRDDARDVVHHEMISLQRRYYRDR